ncbi:MAG: ABC transporter substrate-binding protein [Planctomycetes bacterium]|nr:ABC transporter substrate-binding protein [Planctomycetota bacterium]
MKLKVLIAAIVIIVGLYFLKTQLEKKKEYIPDVPSAAVPGAATAHPEAVKERQHFTVGFIPVTCHLTCPVTSWVTEHSDKGTVFETKKFGEFSSMREALIARQIDATFMITPLAMKLVSDGVPVKIVYLGHRDGSAIIVAANSPIKDFAGLKGKVVAIPSRYSNQNLLMHRMMKKFGMSDDDITLKELPPPDHPSALAAGAIDAYIVGEPHAARAELDGSGRVLYQCGELWPEFISCGLVVRDEVIQEQRALVEELVRGIAASGKWLDSDITTGAQHRKDAAQVVGNVFYNQDPKLLEYVLLKDTGRVKYSNLKPTQERFDEIMQLAFEMKVLPRMMKFDEYCDTSFAPDLETLPLPCDRLPALSEAVKK